MLVVCHTWCRDCLHTSCILERWYLQLRRAKIQLVHFGGQSGTDQVAHLYCSIHFRSGWYHGLRFLRLQVTCRHTGHACFLDSFQRSVRIKRGVLGCTWLCRFALLFLTEEYFLNELALLLLLFDFLHHFIWQTGSWKIWSFWASWSSRSFRELWMNWLYIGTRWRFVRLILLWHHYVILVINESISRTMLIAGIFSWLPHRIQAMVCRNQIVIRFLHRYWFSLERQSRLFLPSRIMSSQIWWRTLGFQACMLLLLILGRIIDIVHSLLISLQSMVSMFNLSAFLMLI